MLMKGFWKLPYRKELDVNKANQDVCVVGIFGKSSWINSNRSFVIKNLIKSHDQPLEPNKKPFHGTSENDENSIFDFMFVFHYFYTWHGLAYLIMYLIPHCHYKVVVVFLPAGPR